MTKQQKEDILNVIESEGLEYALREYTDIFTECDDQKLNRMIECYNKSLDDIKEYLELGDC